MFSYIIRSPDPISEHIFIAKLKETKLNLQNANFEKKITD